MLTTSTFRARVQAFRNRQRGFVAMAAAGDVTDPAAMTSPAEVTSSSSAGAMAELIGTLAVLGAVILTTVVGNALVIAAVVLERNLRSHVANYLVASLAVADLLVALLVMPLAAVNEVDLPLAVYSTTRASSFSLSYFFCTFLLLNHRCNADLYRSHRNNNNNSRFTAIIQGQPALTGTSS